MGLQPLESMQEKALPFLPFHVPDVAADEIQAVVDTLRSGLLTTGSKAKQFEGSVPKLLYTKYADQIHIGSRIIQ